MSRECPHGSGVASPRQGPSIPSLDQPVVSSAEEDGLVRVIADGIDVVPMGILHVYYPALCLHVENVQCAVRGSGQHFVSVLVESEGEYSCGTEGTGQWGKWTRNSLVGVGDVHRVEGDSLRRLQGRLSQGAVGDGILPRPVGQGPAVGRHGHIQNGPADSHQLNFFLYLSYRIPYPVFLGQVVFPLFPGGRVEADGLVLGGDGQLVAVVHVLATEELCPFLLEDLSLVGEKPKEEGSTRDKEGHYLFSRHRFSQALTDGPGCLRKRFLPICISRHTFKTLVLATHRLTMSSFSSLHDSN